LAASKAKLDFILVAGHPALDFVNTLGWRFFFDGPEEYLRSFDDLLHFFVQGRLLTFRQANHLKLSNSPRAAARALLLAKELREAIAGVFYTRLDQGSSSATVLKAMKRYFHVAEPYKSLIWAGPNLHLGWTTMETAPEYPLWLLVRSASNLILSKNIQNVRACDNPNCRRLFLHSNKTSPRRWCHMAICGNRIKQRRFKASSKS
jgi:predicted RNA-binding Zn ribbon-like protein